ncbi:MAG TPA: tetratricopeptide repeat protein [Burkholderiaceae bacterium]
MPYLGIGLHVLVAIFFAVHAVRSGQPIYWLMILFAFPLLGSVVYFLAVWLPDSRLPRGARRMAGSAVKALDPGRELREARAALAETPTAQNQMRLATALLAAGQAAEALACYEICLQGPFARDDEIRFGAARAALECGRGERAAELLTALRSEAPNFRVAEIAALQARLQAAQTKVTGQQP